MDPLEPALPQFDQFRTSASSCSSPSWSSPVFISAWWTPRVSLGPIGCDGLPARCGQPFSFRALPGTQVRGFCLFTATTARAETSRHVFPGGARGNRGYSGN